MTARTALTHRLVNGFGWQGTAAPLAPCCNGWPKVSSPALARIPRGTKKRQSAPSFTAFRPCGCSSASPCLKPAIEAANERGVRPTQRKLIMANIGTFKKSGENGYVGEIVTMSLQKKNVTIVAEEASENENAPSHRVIISKADYA
jgi:hypothetical protein